MKDNILWPSEIYSPNARLDLALQKPTNVTCCINNLKEKNMVILVDVERAFDKFKIQLWLWKSTIKDQTHSKKIKMKKRRRKKLVGRRRQEVHALLHQLTCKETRRPGCFPFLQTLHDQESPPSSKHSCPRGK